MNSEEKQAIAEVLESYFTQTPPRVWRVPCINYEESMKAKRGGARQGAGRKPRDTPRKAITVRLEPQDAAKLRDLCKARELSQADWITDKIRRSRL